MCRYRYKDYKNWLGVTNKTQKICSTQRLIIKTNHQYHGFIYYNAKELSGVKDDPNLLQKVTSDK